MVFAGPLRVINPARRWRATYLGEVVMRSNKNAVWNVASGAVLALVCSVAFAQPSQPGGSASGSNGAQKSQSSKGDKGGKKLERRDRNFVEKAVQHNIAEVETGKLAASKASSDEVKKFGQQMVDDHGKANDELKQIASSKGVSPPDGPDRRHQRAMKDLEKRSGAEFDRTYMSQMVKDHEEDVKEFRDTAKNAKDPDIKAYADKQVPVLTQHLDMARKVASSVGAKSGDKKSGDKKSGSSKSGADAGSGSAGGAGSGGGR
jgi:putative membrane protein